VTTSRLRLSAFFYDGALAAINLGFAYALRRAAARMAR
jgi:hypothetical protein